jgi:hypothetical protein
MAENSVHGLPYKRSVSTNDKENFIKERLRRLEIAYSILAKYPTMLEEFVCAVKEGEPPCNGVDCT